MSGPRIVPSRAEAIARALSPGADETRATLTRMFEPVPVVVGQLVHWDPTTSLLPTPAARVLCVSFEVTGPLKARMTLVTSDEATLRFGSALLRRPMTSLDLATREALAELGNIIASAFLNGLARATNLKLLPTVPALSEPAPKLVAGLVAPPGLLSFVTPASLTTNGVVATAAFVTTPEEGTVERLLALRR